MGDMISIAKIFIDGEKTGSKQLFRVKSIKETDDSDVTVVTVVGLTKGAGFQRKPGGGGFDLEVLREKGKPEVPWRQAKKEDWNFSLTLADEGGERVQATVCRVANVSGDSDDSGSNMYSVKIVFLELVPLPTVTT